MNYIPDPYTIISIVTAFLYMLLLLGIVMLLRKQLALIPDYFNQKRRFSRIKKEQLEEKLSSKHLNNLLKTVMKKPISSSAFIALSLAFFIIIFAVSVSTLSIFQSFVVACCFTGLPYLLLRMKLERIRRKGSFEGEELVALLLTQYWASELNIMDTIEKVIVSGKNIKITSKVLSSMLIEIRSTGNKERIKRATDSFAYSINTSWSKMLAYHFRTAILSGSDIGLALEDILVQLREARALMEERKRINGESARITVFLIPILYLGSVLASIAFLGLTPLDFIKNQFFTPEGAGLFVISLFLFILNLVLLEIITNRKLDF